MTPTRHGGASNGSFPKSRSRKATRFRDGTRRSARINVMSAVARPAATDGRLRRTGSDVTAIRSDSDTLPGSRAELQRHEKSQQDNVNDGGDENAVELKAEQDCHIGKRNQNAHVQGDFDLHDEARSPAPNSAWASTSRIDCEFAGGNDAQRGAADLDDFGILGEDAHCGIWPDQRRHQDAWRTRRRS